MPEPEEQIPPGEEPTEETPPAAPPTPEPVHIEEHKEPSFATWTAEEKENLLKKISEIGESINGKKTKEPESNPAPAGETDLEPTKRKRGLRFKSKRK